MRRMGMSKVLRFAVAAALCAGVVGATPASKADPANESVCDTTIRVFSFYSVDVDEETSVSQPASADIGGVGCNVVTDADGVDPRYIEPGSNLISVTVDLSPPEDAEPVFGTVTHPDGTVEDIELTPGAFVDGSCCRYRSPSIAIDPEAQGHYRVSIDFYTEVLTDTYRTIGTPTDKPGYLP
jgi:hypothetical protein